MAAALRPGDTLLLEGEIGAGKSFFARALIQTLMAERDRVEDVPSPTFTLVQTYDLGDLEVWHADLYRLSGPDEVIELGLDEAFRTAICLVEWPDRLAELRPPAALTMQFTAQADDSRTLLLHGGPDWARIDAVLRGAE